MIPGQHFSVKQVALAIRECGGFCCDSSAPKTWNRTAASRVGLPLWGRVLSCGDTARFERLLLELGKSIRTGPLVARYQTKTAPAKNPDFGEDPGLVSNTTSAWRPFQLHSIKSGDRKARDISDMTFFYHSTHTTLL